MKKSSSLLAACLSSGLFYGMTSDAISQDVTPPGVSLKLSFPFDDIPVSQAGNAGSIVSEGGPLSVVAARDAGDATLNSADFTSVSALQRVVDSKNRSAVIRSLVVILESAKDQDGAIGGLNNTQIGPVTEGTTSLARNAVLGGPEVKVNSINEAIFALERLEFPAP